MVLLRPTASRNAQNIGAPAYILDAFYSSLGKNFAKATMYHCRKTFKNKYFWLNYSLRTNHYVIVLESTSFDPSLKRFPVLHSVVINHFKNHSTLLLYKLFRANARNTFSSSCP